MSSLNKQNPLISNKSKNACKESKNFILYKMSLYKIYSLTSIQWLEFVEYVAEKLRKERIQALLPNLSKMRKQKRLLKILLKISSIKLMTNKQNSQYLLLKFSKKVIISWISLLSYTEQNTEELIQLKMRKQFSRKRNWISLVRENK